MRSIEGSGPPDSAMLAPLDIRYLAGFIDGEGCFSATATTRKGGPSRYYRCVLIVGNSDRSILERIKATVGVGVVGVLDTQRQRKYGHKLVYYWSVTGWQAAQVIRTLLPFLVVKAEAARELLALLDLIHEGRGGLRLSADDHERRMAHIARIREINRKTEGAVLKRLICAVVGHTRGPHLQQVDMGAHHWHDFMCARCNRRFRVDWWSHK